MHSKCFVFYLKYNTLDYIDNLAQRYCLTLCLICLSTQKFSIWHTFVKMHIKDKAEQTGADKCYDFVHLKMNLQH